MEEKEEGDEGERAITSEIRSEPSAAAAAVEEEWSLFREGRMRGQIRLAQ